MLYESGAKEVHVRIACPENKISRFLWCRYATKEELLAHEKNNKEMCEYIKAKSLRFLSLEGFIMRLSEKSATSLILNSVTIILLETIQ